MLFFLVSAQLIPDFQAFLLVKVVVFFWNRGPRVSPVITLIFLMHSRSPEPGGSGWKEIELLLHGAFCCLRFTNPNQAVYTLSISIFVPR